MAVIFTVLMCSILHMPTNLFYRRVFQSMNSYFIHINIYKNTTTKKQQKNTHTQDIFVDWMPTMRITLPITTKCCFGTI